LRIHRQLTEDVQEWVALNRDPGALYRGARLTVASEWAKDHADEMNPLEREFHEASRALQAKEARARRLIRAAVLAGLLTIVGILVIAVLIFGRQADENARLAARNKSGQLAAQVQVALDRSPRRSLLLAVEALNTTARANEPRAPAAEDALRQALSNTGGHPLSGHESNVFAVAFSPDGKWLATGSEDGTARLWHTRLDELMELACNLAGRNLTRAEWAQYFPGEPYRKTCGQWPEGE